MAEQQKPDTQAPTTPANPAGGAGDSQPGTDTGQADYGSAGQQAADGQQEAEAHPS
ncbi:hypothetical protein [Sphingomonas jatrophae]|uniref:Uncharacterized protein n=1 Tax=Sphingomonas jatrophae TaxID=1166337 RepID=A0A1I6KY44_9SPHN|nr:hypothetical protein [Sphingomonas jatrophae]SFR96173.1 hypothetical protein SAMN05192580_1939 [Sphingomonas jatrophae]